MGRHIVILVLIVITVFVIVISLYTFLGEPLLDGDLRSYQGIQPGNADNPPFRHEFNYKILKSDGTGNLINQPGECKIWSSGDKIQGGTNATIGEFPCIALLQYAIGHNEYSSDCAGSLINKRYVVTAAHCLKDKHLVNIVLGEYDTSKDPDHDEDNEPLPKSVNIGFEELIIHEDYNERLITNDIALIRLSKDVEYEQYHIQPICIPNSTFATDVGQSVTVGGWGSTGTKAKSIILQSVALPIFDINECQKIFPHVNSSTQLCAGGQKGKDAWTRDSGGPLIVQFNKQKTYLEGIVSYGKAGALEGIPGVYTRVGYYHDWILGKLKN